MLASHADHADFLSNANQREENKEEVKEMRRTVRNSLGAEIVVTLKSPLSLPGETMKKSVGDSSDFCPDTPSTVAMTPSPKKLDHSMFGATSSVGFDRRRNSENLKLMEQQQMLGDANSTSAFYNPMNYTDNAAWYQSAAQQVQYWGDNVPNYRFSGSNQSGTWKKRNSGSPGAKGWSRSSTENYDSGNYYANNNYANNNGGNYRRSSAYARASQNARNSGHYWGLWGSQQSLSQESLAAAVSRSSSTHFPDRVSSVASTLDAWGRLEEEDEQDKGTDPGAAKKRGSALRRSATGQMFIGQIDEVSNYLAKRSSSSSLSPTVEETLSEKTARLSVSTTASTTASTNTLRVSVVGSEDASTTSSSSVSARSLPVPTTNGVASFTPSSVGLRSFWGAVSNPLNELSASTTPSSSGGVSSNSYFYSNGKRGGGHKSFRSGVSPFGGTSVAPPREEDDAEDAESGDGYSANFRKTIVCVGAPIHADLQSRFNFERTQSGSIVGVEELDDYQGTTILKYILKDRASTESLRLSAHSAPWPTSVTHLDHAKLSLREFRERVSELYDEFKLGGDYKEFADQIHGLQCRPYHDTLVSVIFRKSLDLRKAETEAETQKKSAKKSSPVPSTVVPSTVGSAVSHFACANKILGKLARERRENTLIISPSSLFRGLYCWISQISDLELDVPHASSEIMKLLEEFAEQGILDPTVLCRVPEQILEKAQNCEARYDCRYAKILTELRVFKEEIHDAFTEYFKSLNISRLESRLGDLNMPDYHHQFVCEAILTAMDFGEAERKHVGHLFQRLLRKSILVDEDIQHGVALAVGQIEELSNTDVPYAKEYFVQVLADCVTCEVVSADLVKKFRMLQYGGASGEVAFQQTLHRTPEYSRKIWGPDGASGLSSLLTEIDDSISEYLDSFDCEEVARIVGELHLSRDLDVYFIKQILLRCMERGTVDPLGLKVLLHLKDVYWKSEDVENAIEAIRNDEDDLVLDFPGLRTATNEMIEKCLQNGLVSEKFYRLAAIQYTV